MRYFRKPEFFVETLDGCRYGPFKSADEAQRFAMSFDAGDVVWKFIAKINRTAKVLSEGFAPGEVVRD